MANREGSREARASVKYHRASATKARFVLNQIRGLHVEEARRVLLFSQRGISRDIAKVLDAAVANAQQVLSAGPETLFVSRCWADEGPTLKRWSPRALGRATRIRKRTCHITLTLTSRES